MAQKQTVSAASKRHRRFYRKYTPQRIPHGYFSLVGQSFSALGASSLQDVSAVSGSHSLSEAMLLLSLTLFRLISSQHMNCTSLINFVLRALWHTEFFRKREAFQLSDTLLHNDILLYLIKGVFVKRF